MKRITKLMMVLVVAFTVWGCGSGHPNPHVKLEDVRSEMKDFMNGSPFDGAANEAEAQGVVTITNYTNNNGDVRSYYVMLFGNESGEVNRFQVSGISSNGSDFSILALHTLSTIYGSDALNELAEKLHITKVGYDEEAKQVTYSDYGTSFTVSFDSTTGTVDLTGELK